MSRSSIPLYLSFGDAVSHLSFAQDAAYQHRLVRPFGKLEGPKQSQCKQARRNQIHVNPIDYRLSEDLRLGLNMKGKGCYSSNLVNQDYCKLLLSHLDFDSFQIQILRQMAYSKVIKINCLYPVIDFNLNHSLMISDPASFSSYFYYS